ncbi:MAG: 50S ribosomal protein L9, partial [Acidimicrobiia bacterium]
MRLILTADVADLGRRGDVVDVANGYARNYLLPRRKAVEATEGSLRSAETLRRAREEAIRKAREEAERIATALVGARVVIAAQAGDEGKLFGS